MSGEITKRLAEFCVGEVAYGKRERHQAAQIVDACLQQGKHARRGHAIVRMLDSLTAWKGEGAPEAQAWGASDRHQAEWAAFRNAFFLNAVNKGRGGYEVVVVPSAAAVAELMDASAIEFFEAVIVGLEVAERMQLGLGRTHADRGWDLIGTAGVVASSAAVARLLGLDRDQTEQAFGLATTQIAGLRGQGGTDAMNLHAAKAALNGVEACRLIGHGLDGPRRIIEGRRGLLALASDDPAADSIVVDLGARWLFAERAAARDDIATASVAPELFLDTRSSAQKVLEQLMAA